MIYTTNTIEGYNRQLRKVIKNKASFPTVQSKDTLPGQYPYHQEMDQTNVQLAIRFGERFPL